MKRLAGSMGARIRRRLVRLFDDPPPEAALAEPQEPLCLAEKNHRFAAEVIREAREHAEDRKVETTFAEAVIHSFVKGIHRPMFEHYVRYALGSLYRGEKLAHLYCPENAEIASYLDVGCAYGGAPVALARRGIDRAVGFEHDERLLRLARVLAAEEGVSDRVTFVSGDLTRREDTAALGSFDLVTCIDVLEHVLDPEAAIANLAALTASGGTAIVDVPNPLAYQSIQRDPHHHIFGSVLLDRDDAIRVFEDESAGNKRYTVGYFHPLEWYLERLEAAGFAVEVMDAPSTEPEAIERTLEAVRGLRDQLEAASADWPAWRTELVRAALERFLADAGDLERHGAEDPAAFQLRHAVPVHHLRCCK